MAIRNKQKIAAAAVAALALFFLLSLPVSAGSFTSWFSMSSGSTSDLYSIWGPDSSNVFAVGQAGTILHYNGSAWRSMNSRTTGDLFCVWGADGSNVFAVGKAGTILFYDGSGWSPMTSGTPNDLYGVWGSDSESIYAVGIAGTLLYYDGSTWSSVTGGSTSDLTSVWGVNASNIFIVGKAGTILYYDGSTWSPMTGVTANNLACVWGVDKRHVYAVGSSGAFLSYDGSNWSLETSGITANLLGIRGIDRKNIFIVGESGTIAYYDGSEFSSMSRNTLNNLHSVLGFSTADVFTAGPAGTILRYLPPAIDSVAPVQADQGENLDVTITGMNLGGANDVRFGAGIAVNSFTVVDSQHIKANITVIAGAASGERDVSVVTPGGSFTLPGSITLKQVLPTVSLISPDRDRQDVTLNVTISGTDLTWASDVSLGPGISVNSFNVLSSTQITANITIAADAETGKRDVTVTTPLGSISLPGSFTVKQTLPSITSISPTQGNQEMSLTITIDGKNLTGASEVQFGENIIVKNFTVLSPDQIAANISLNSAAAEGVRDVSVTTPGGSVTLPNSFTVKQALPTITFISPDNGSQGATLNITIMGTNLTRTSQLRLGTGIAVNSFTVLDSNRITAGITIVAGTETGARDVSVTTPGGSFALPNGFTVKQGLPVITSISPENGSQGVTLTVIISGSNLEGATFISFGSGVDVQSLTNLSPTQLRASILVDENAVTGLRDVSVTTPGGSSTLANRFNINKKSLGVVFIALIWVGIAVVIGLFILIITILRKKRAAYKQN
jgi:hypothetical protein